MPCDRLRGVRARRRSRRRPHAPAGGGRGGHRQALDTPAGSGPQHHRQVRVEGDGVTHGGRLQARFGRLQGVRAVALLHQAETGRAHLHRAGHEGLRTRRTAVYRWRVDTIAPTAPAVTRRQLRMDGGRRHPRRRPDRPTRAGAASPPTSTAARPTAGAPWTTAAAGASAKVTVNGTTWVQFRGAGQGRERLRLGARERRSGRHGDDRHRPADAAGAHRRRRDLAERGLGDRPADRHADRRGIRASPATSTAPPPTAARPGRPPPRARR